MTHSALQPRLCPLCLGLEALRHLWPCLIEDRAQKALAAAICASPAAHLLTFVSNRSPLYSTLW